MAKIDLTQTPGNPAFDLRQAYPKLMLITDRDALVAEALQLVQARVGHGMSQGNFDDFVRIIQSKRSLQQVQFYLTSFILSAAGLKAMENVIASIADLISEDLTEEQEDLRRLVGRFGYHVGRLAS